VVPFSISSLKLTQKAALLIMVPLCLQLIFVAILILSVNQAEKENEEEARANERLAAVNTVFNDALNVAGSIAMSKALDDPRFIDDLRRNLLNFSEHRKALEDFGTGPNNSEAEEAALSLALVDDAKGLLDEAMKASNTSEAYANIKELAKVKAFVGRVNAFGKYLIDKRAKHNVYREQQLNNRNRLRLIIEVCSCINVLVALVMAGLFNATFANRMKALMTNTTNIAMEKPLEQPLAGTDELSQLDNVMHTLSSELSIARQKERAMVENAADVILSLDERLRITQLNPAVTRMLGYSSDDLLGSSVQILIHDEDRDLTFKNLERSKAGSAEITFEARAKRRDGRYLFVTWTSRWSKPERTIFCTLHDITERVQSERLKADIMAMVSHDLRSSLNSLGITLDLLIEGHLGKLNDKGSSMITKSHASVKVLLDMIHDLLEVERFESGSFVLAYETASDRDIAQQAIDMVYAQADKKNIKITLNLADLQFEADPERLRRVFLNLLNNAIKFSPELGIISITSAKVSGEYGENQAEIRIDDQGPGIPPDKVALVFEKFKQLEQGDGKEQQGSGLGLAICKAIIEAHGGSIGVDRTMDGGSSFWFRVPLRRPKAPSSDASASINA
jgi:PAS domain S-box-containing protein